MKPIRISWSALRTHDECGMKARLIREGKRSPVKDLRNYYHGMVVDSVMQQWLADPQRRPGQMTTMVDAAIVDGLTEARSSGDGMVRWRNPDDRAQLRQFCLDLVDRLEPLLARHVLPYHFRAPYRFEVPVVVAGSTVLLVGEMDILVHHQPGYVVLDLKATADDQYWRRVAGQLTFYDLAVLGLFGEPTRAVGLIQPMCPQQMLGITITDEDRRQMWARIQRMVEEIRTDAITCKSGTAGCTWCEVRHACPRYAPEADSLGLGLRRAAEEARQ